MGLFKGIRDRAKKERHKESEKASGLSQKDDSTPTGKSEKQGEYQDYSSTPAQLEELSEIFIKIQTSSIDVERSLKQMGNEISQAQNMARSKRAEENILQDLDKISNNAHSMFELLQDIKNTLESSAGKLQNS